MPLPMTRRAAALALTGALAVTVPVAADRFTLMVGSLLPADRREGDVSLIAPAAPDSRPAVQAPASTPSRVPMPAADTNPVPTPAPVETPVPSPAPGVTSVPSPAPGEIPAPPPQPPGEISGVVRDPSGAVVPGTPLTLTRRAGLEDTVSDADMGLDIQRVAVTDHTGQYRFPSLPPGRYSLLTSLPPFATIRYDALTVEAGDRLERDVQLRMGTVAESTIVLCPATRAAEVALQPVVFVPAAYARPRRDDRVDEPELSIALHRASSVAQQDASSSSPVRIGGHVTPPVRTTRAVPVCPHVVLPDGDVVVILEAMLSEEGSVLNARSIRPGAGATHPESEFAEAALAAVRQWTYTPALLNGRPTSLILTVSVVYRRS